jgi:hypothetical protein
MANSDKPMLQNAGIKCLYKLSRYPDHLRDEQKDEAISIFVSFLQGIKWNSISSQALLFLSESEEQDFINILLSLKALSLLAYLFL